MLTQQIKLASEPEDNPFVPDNNKIADVALHEMVVHEDQEDDSDIDTSFLRLLIRTCCVIKIVSYITF